MPFEHYDPEKPALISLGLQKLVHDSWDGSERRRKPQLKPRRTAGFLEVKVPTYCSNDKTNRADGYYPSGN